MKKILKIYYYYLLCMCVCIWVYVEVGAWQWTSSEARVLDPLEMESQVAVSHPMWLLSTELWSFATTEPSLQLPKECIFVNHQPLSILVVYTSSKLRVPRSLKSQSRFPWKPCTGESKVHGLQGWVLICLSISPCKDPFGLFQPCFFICKVDLITPSAT